MHARVERDLAAVGLPLDADDLSSERRVEVDAGIAAARRGGEGEGEVLAGA